MKETLDPNHKCGCACSDGQADNIMAKVDKIIDDYVNIKGGLIPVLQVVQSAVGYLPDDVLQHIAFRLGKSFSEVAGVVSFYSFFSRFPKGKYTVRVCLGTACYVRGGKDILDALKHHLKIDVGQTTSDKIFSLEVGRCFGACGLAPVVLINEDVHRRVKPHSVGELLDKYRKEHDSAKETVKMETCHV